MSSQDSVAEAAESDLTRLLVAVAIDFVRSASTNHSVVGFGEIRFGSVPGTASVERIHLERNTPVAIVGNLVRGVLLIAFVRSIQVGAE